MKKKTRKKPAAMARLSAHADSDTKKPKRKPHLKRSNILKGAQANSNDKIIITCEHGGNKIPARYAKYFTQAAKALESHRGWDPGAKLVAQDIAYLLEAPAFTADISRLLIDLNRSENHKTAYSEFSGDLPAIEKERILETHYRPYRNQVRAALSKALQSKTSRAFHFSMHSFTPVLHGEIRNCEIGILYDPRVALEKGCAEQLQKQIRSHLPDLRVRMNYPYKGTGDGFTTQLRREHPKSRYSGIEIELNQKLVESLKSTRDRMSFSKILALCLEQALKSV